MTYRIEEWDYEDKAEIEKVIDFFRKNRRLVVLIDDEQDRGFIIVGNSEYKEVDLKQAERLLEVVNSQDFHDKNTETK